MYGSYGHEYDFTRSLFPSQITYLQHLGKQVETLVRQGIEGWPLAQKIADFDEFDFHGSIVSVGRGYRQSHYSDFRCMT